jgi:hypothetical protein
MLAGKAVKKAEADRLLGQAAKIELSGVLGRSAEKSSEVEGGKNPVVVSLGLARKPLKTKAEAAAAEGAKDGGGDEILAPEVAERKILHLADHPGKSTAALAYLEGADFAVEVDRWRIEDLLQADPTKLAE